MIVRRFEMEYQRYCSFCEDEEGEPIAMEIHGDLWVCPECGTSVSIDEEPQVCAACGGPWPDCMKFCKLFDD